MPAAQHHARFYFTLVTLSVSYNWPRNAAAFSVAMLRTALLVQSALWRSKDTLGRLSRFRSTPYRGNQLEGPSHTIPVVFEGIQKGEFQSLMKVLLRENLPMSERAYTPPQ